MLQVGTRNASIASDCQQALDNKAVRLKFPDLKRNMQKSSKKAAGILQTGTEVLISIGTTYCISRNLFFSERYNGYNTRCVVVHQFSACLTWLVNNLLMREVNKLCMLLLLLSVHEFSL